jgi:hypothetical protein
MKQLLLSTTIILFCLLFTSVGWSDYKFNVLVKGTYNCIQTVGKNYFSDQSIDNVVLNAGPVLIKQDGEKLEMDFGNGLVSEYIYHRGFALNTDEKDFMNFLYVSKLENDILATQTLSLLIGDHGIHLILTEPLTGNKRTFVRLSFFDCKYIGDS